MYLAPSKILLDKIVKICHNGDEWTTITHSKTRNKPWKIAWIYKLRKQLMLKIVINHLSEIEITANGPFAIATTIMLIALVLAFPYIL